MSAFRVRNPVKTMVSVSYRTTIGAAMMCLTALVFSSVYGIGHASEIKQYAGEKTTPEFVPAEIKKRVRPHYPPSESHRLGEGWVLLEFMIDTKGRVYEVAVIDSQGSSLFEKEAIRTVKKWRYEPASLDGNPIESHQQARIVFNHIVQPNGASPTFHKKYKSLLKLIGEGDQAKAEDGLSELRKVAKNRYEVRWISVADSAFQAKWGTKRQQLVALGKALAGVTGSSVLPPSTLLTLFYSKFRLELELNELRSALETYEKLKRLQNLPRETAAELEEIIAVVNESKDDRIPFAVNKQIDERGNWHYKLLWNKFSLAAESGEIVDVKVRCQTQLVNIDFAENMAYEVKGDAGLCTLMLRGEPGDQITLVQLQ